MNKSRQKELTRWLKQQSVISQRWLNISRLLGFVSGILIIAQAWFMARILQHMIMVLLITYLLEFNQPMQ